MLLGDASVSGKPAANVSTPVPGLHLSALPPVADSKGGAFFRLPQLLSQGFILDFTISISPRAKACERWRGHPNGDPYVGDAGEGGWCRLRAADGAALVLTAGAGAGGEAYLGEVPALGDGGAGMGYEGEKRRDALATRLSHRYL